jgi:hypothetical protein
MPVLHCICFSGFWYKYFLHIPCARWIRRIHHCDVMSSIPVSSCKPVEHVSVKFYVRCLHQMLSDTFYFYWY